MSKLVRPFTVTDAALTTSNVVETTPSAYNGATTYALGNQVSVFSGINSTVATMYESLQNSNTGNTPASSPAWWQPIGTAYLAYNAGTSYSLDAIVSDNTGHRLYQSLVNANLGNALTDATKWLDIAPTNKWAMFDQINSTQTTRPLSVSTKVTVAGRANAVGLVNIDAADLNITVTDGVTEYYNEDFSLTDNTGIDDYYEYFFEEIVRLSDKYVDGLPDILNPVITVTLTSTGDVSVGNLVIGKYYELGDAQYGAQIGNTDYSRITTDDFGNSVVVQRASAKRGQFTIWMPSTRVDQAFRILDSFRATPILFVGSDSYGSTVQFGLLKDWHLELTYPNHSILSLETQALT